MKFSSRFLSILLSLFAFFIIYSCIRLSEDPKKLSLKIKETTSASFETTPVPQVNNEDAADDPAIWINPEDVSQSRIIGTDKKGGLAVYNLQGEQLFYYPDGMMNNVDLRQGILLGNDTIDVLCSSNRSNQSISVYKVNTDGSLVSVAARVIVSEMEDEVYGFCLYKSPKSEKVFAFINSKKGEVEQWELLAADSLVDARLVRKFKLGTQVEGMVADDENQKIFIGEEVNGIWVFDAEPDGSIEGDKVAQSSEDDNKQINFDLEGLAFYYLPNGEGYLLASSQGNYSYAVYNRKPPYAYLGSFRIVDGIVDGAEETDGLEIFSNALNEDFAHGLLVVQDGFNKDNDLPVAQNFKLIAWENVANLFDPQLKMN